MNLLILNWRDIKHPQGGGAEVHLHSIFGRLAAWGHQVTFCTTRFPGCAAEETIDGMRVLRLGHTFFFNWEAPFLISKLSAGRPFDCIIDDVNKIPFFSPLWFRRTPTCAFFHHLFGTTIFELTAYPMALYVLWLEKLSGWGYRKSPVCTVSKSTAAELISAGIPEANITIIENSVDTNQYCPDAAVAKEDGLLLYTGRIKKYKNVALLIDAVAAITRTGRAVQLVVAGTGDDEQRCKNYAVERGVAGRVRFTGHIDEAAKIDLYRRAALFVNPSIKEGWGITNIEANACGTAVIANDAPGLRDSVRNGVTGVLYRENNLDALVEATIGLLDNKDKRAHLERGGREWALSFSWDSSARRVEQWLQRVISRR